jgi:hypothetical protein
MRYGLLPGLNAILYGTSAILTLAGYACIRRGNRYLLRFERLEGAGDGPGLLWSARKGLSLRSQRPSTANFQIAASSTL